MWATQCKKTTIWRSLRPIKFMVLGIYGSWHWIYHIKPTIFQDMTATFMVLLGSLEVRRKSKGCRRRVTCSDICVYIFVCMYWCIYICNVYIYVFMYVCMYVYIYVCMCVWVCTCVCIYRYVKVVAKPFLCADGLVYTSKAGDLTSGRSSAWDLLKPRSTGGTSRRKAKNTRAASSLGLPRGKRTNRCGKAMVSIGTANGLKMMGFLHLC